MRDVSTLTSEDQVAIATDFSDATNSVGMRGGGRA